MGTPGLVSQLRRHRHSSIKTCFLGPIFRIFMLAVLFRERKCKTFFSIDQFANEQQQQIYHFRYHCKSRNPLKRIFYWLPKNTSKKSLVGPKTNIIWYNEQQHFLAGQPVAMLCINLHLDEHICLGVRSIEHPDVLSEKNKFLSPGRSKIRQIWPRAPWPNIFWGW